MLQIQDTLVSLDVVECFFCCDLDACLGQCCVEGDSGAPLEHSEYEPICDAVPTVWDDLTPSGQEELTRRGPAFYDADGDLVTSIVGDRDCVFTTYAPGGKCLCALDKACREGRLPADVKPISCSLYPIRLTQYDGFTAVNYHRWKICRSAEKKGQRLGIRVYQFLKAPLIRRFGAEWYAELELTATEYLKSKNH